MQKRVLETINHVNLTTFTESDKSKMGKDSNVLN